MIAGPRQKPLVGNLLEFRAEPLRFVMDLLRHGDLARFRLGPEEILLVSAPHHLKRVFQDNYKNYGKQSRVWRKMEPLLGRGLITSEGDEWLRQRRAAQPSFHRDPVAGFAGSITRATLAMLDRWRPGAPIEAVGEMMRLTLAILGDTLFG